LGFCRKRKVFFSGQKGLELDLALAYWNIVLKGRFKYLDVWTSFLKVKGFRLLQRSRFHNAIASYFFLSTGISDTVPHM
jgi:hypothetical protein